MVDNGDLLKVDGSDAQLICAAADVPITLGGAASHNVANALAAAALTDRLGIALDDVRRGLKTMSSKSTALFAPYLRTSLSICVTPSGPHQKSCGPAFDVGILRYASS